MKMLLNDLKVENFRALENIAITQLGRVNVIVGKNNVGKSSLLEAIEVYASLGEPALLEKLLKKHSENYGENSLAIENFFTFRSEKLDKHIYVGSCKEEEFVKLIPTYSRLDIKTKGKVETRRRIEIPYGEMEKHEDIKLTLKIEAKNRKIESPKEKGRFKPEGIFFQWCDFFSYDKNQYRQAIKITQDLGFPCVVIPTGFINLSQLADAWDSVSLNIEYKKIILNALTLFDKDIEDLAFLKLNKIASNDTNDDSDISLSDIVKVMIGNESSRFPFVVVKGYDKPIPLDSMGDGVKRVLQLLISIVQAKGGFFLVDEFENGLHYSVQKEIWSLMFSLAKKLEIQIFATTHSLDCVKGFQKISEIYEEPAMLFNFSRSRLTSENNKVIVDEYDKERLKTLVESEWELR